MSASQQAQSGSLDNIKPLLEERGELHILKKRCEDRIKELDTDLRPMLEGRGEMVHAGYSFKCTMTPGRKSLDKAAVTEALAAYGLAIEDYEKEGAPFTTMTVKQVQTL